MRYPTLSKKDPTILITASSNGVGHKLESFDESINILKDHGFTCIETDSCRNNQKIGRAHV